MTMKTDKPPPAPPPPHLRPATAAWWTQILTDFALESHHLRLLELAATAWDRAEGAREVIDKLGISYEDRFGAPRARPEVAVERDSRIGFARLIRELGLDTAGTPSAAARPIQPPSLKY